MKALLVSLILIPVLSQACDMDRMSSETQFVIDPSTGKVKQESKNNFSKFEISKCSADEKYVLVNLNSIYYQDDTARTESISGTLVQKASNCSIQAPVPFQKVEISFLESLIQQRHRFIRSCTRLVFADLRGQKIQSHPQSQCQLKNLDATGSVVEAEGSGCLIAMNPNSKIAVEARFNPDCAQAGFLQENQIQAQDIESVVKVWPVAVDGGKILPLSPIGARYLRHTILPVEGFMPRSVKENQDQMPFVSALATNVSPGNISISSMGKNLVSIQPTFLVENLAKEFCREGQCARTSSYMSPIAGILTLTQVNLAGGKRKQIGEWNHALKVPSNWSGLAEFKAENNLTGISMGSLTAQMNLAAGDEYVLEAKFYEPRGTLDEWSYSQSFFDLDNNLNIDGSGEEALPTLPKVGQLGRLERLQQLPAVGLGRAGVLEFSDRFNSSRNWPNKYDRICNSQNLKCQRINGMDRPFTTMKMFFKIGANKEILAQRIVKQSDVFESYDQVVTSFAKKVCE
jgi:hypothetical protein